MSSDIHQCLFHDYRITEWLRLNGPLSPPSSKPLHGQGCPPPDRAAQGPVQPGLECLQEWNTHSFSGQRNRQSLLAREFKGRVTNCPFKINCTKKEIGKQQKLITLLPCLSVEKQWKTDLRWLREDTVYVREQVIWHMPVSLETKGKKKAAFFSPNITSACCFCYKELKKNRIGVFQKVGLVVLVLQYRLTTCMNFWLRSVLLKLFYWCRGSSRHIPTIHLQALHSWSQNFSMECEIVLQTGTIMICSYPWNTDLEGSLHTHICLKNRYPLWNTPVSSKTL